MIWMMIAKIALKLNFITVLLIKVYFTIFVYVANRITGHVVSIKQISKAF